MLDNAGQQGGLQETGRTIITATGKDAEDIAAAQTWNMSKNVHRQDFSDENFTRKSVNYDKCPSTTKQRKILVYNKIITLGVFTLDNLTRVILPR